MSVPDPTPSRVAARGRDPSRAAWYNLGFFSTALFALPLAAYYGAKDKWLGGNATYAGGLAAIVANLVVVGYVVVAFLEDDGTPQSAGTRATKQPGSARTEDKAAQKETRKDR